MDEMSRFAESASVLITRQARKFAAELGESSGTSMLVTFNGYVAETLKRYGSELDRLSPEKFADLYSAAQSRQSDDEEWRIPSTVVAALIAAELDFCSPAPLNARQNIWLAEKFERIGIALSRSRVPPLEELAFRRATRLYALGEDRAGEDRCGLRSYRARTGASESRWRRLAGHLVYVLCGYGYRPSWLLGWMVVQIFLFTVAGFLLGGSTSPTTTVYLMVTAFLGPVGPTGAHDMGETARPLFALESWLGAVSMIVFVTLLVRRWFRI